MSTSTWQVPDCFLKPGGMVMRCGTCETGDWGEMCQGGLVSCKEGRGEMVVPI